MEAPKTNNNKKVKKNVFKKLKKKQFLKMTNVQQERYLFKKSRKFFEKLQKDGVPTPNITILVNTVDSIVNSDKKNPHKYSPDDFETNG